MILPVVALLHLLACQSDADRHPDPGPTDDPKGFYFGADLSYVNQILDYGGVYADGGEVRNPYRIFKDHGTHLVRFRLWHDPQWTREVYEPDGPQMYNDYADVERAIASAKEHGMKVLLDFHYSDTWADPGKQEVPAAWKGITDIEILKDSVYRYTKKVLDRLESKGLMPEFIQTGNEINCGMLYTNASPDFPSCNACDGAWGNLGAVLNSAIAAVRDVSSSSATKPKVILHVADPQHLEWWFDNIMGNGEVTDFDIIGFSYYPLWHTTVKPDKLEENVKRISALYDRPLMILETAYPWTTDGDDNYTNIFGGQAPLAGYPYTPQGQHNMMRDLAQAMINAGGIGLVYWEPAWITSDMNDLWGAGSAWENCTFFDFDGNAHMGMDYMTAEYE